ncbi:MAG TPA: hypothetical protein VLG47_01425 [Candidatus Saccharimonadales bacterium]|nr:hypothetical protein [Candidatus Saccharimonadales bacterium]
MKQRFVGYHPTFQPEQSEDRFYPGRLPKLSVLRDWTPRELDIAWSGVLCLSGLVSVESTPSTNTVSESAIAVDALASSTESD